MAVTSPPRRTQEQRRTDARGSLIEAAAELIAEGGMASLTLANVGARAGYSRGIANHHFGSKAQLVTELVDHVEQEFVAATVPAEGSADPFDATIEVVRAFFALLVDLPMTHRAFLVLWASAVTGDEEIRQRMNESDNAFRRGLTGTLKRVRRVEGHDPFDPAATAAIVLGMLRGVALQYLLNPEVLDLGALERGVCDTIRRLASE